MNNKFWNIFINLQKMAYRSGALTQDYIQDQIIDKYKERFYQYFPINDIENILVLGPGGLAELKLMKGIFHNINLLNSVTIFEEEANHLRINGYEASIGDFHTLQYNTESFDFIFSNNVFEHSLSPYIALMESRRVLKSSSGYGYIVLPTFPGTEGGIGPYHLYCLDDTVWSELLNKTGFELLHKEYIQGDILPDIGYFHYFIKTKPLNEPHASVFRNLIKLRNKNG